MMMTRQDLIHLNYGHSQLLIESSYFGLALGDLERQVVLLGGETADGSTAAAARGLGRLRRRDGDLDNAVRKVVAFANEPLQVADEHGVEVVAHCFVESLGVVQVGAIPNLVRIIGDLQQKRDSVNIFWKLHVRPNERSAYAFIETIVRPHVSLIRTIISASATIVHGSNQPLYLDLITKLYYLRHSRGRQVPYFAIPLIF